jgi:hypothetical protein
MKAMRVEFDLTDPVEQRCTRRHDTRLSARVRRAGPSRVPGTITDLSTTGFQLQCEEPLRRGTAIWVTMGSLAPLQARVMWSRALLAGCAFITPLHPAILDHLVASSD